MTLKETDIFDRRVWKQPWPEQLQKQQNHTDTDTDTDNLNPAHPCVPRGAPGVCQANFIEK